MKYILSHFMEQSGTVKDPGDGKDVIVDGRPINAPKSVMLNTVQIVSPDSFKYAIGGGIKDFRFYYTNVVKQFNGLRTKYTRDLYSSLKSKYGLQIVMLDTYNRFLKNVLNENSSLYQDGIHFTDISKEDRDHDALKESRPERGMEYWGRAIAITMTYYKWLTLNDPADGGQLFVDVEVGDAAGTINAKSKLYGIDLDQVNGTEVDSHNHGFSKYFPQEPIVITYMEIDYEFDNDKSVYVRNGDTRAYTVRGDIRLMYEGNGGPDGVLGFPLQDEYVGSIFESYRSQVFECGTIIKNYFDLITPQSMTLNETSPECLAKKARDAN